MKMEKQQATGKVKKPFYKKWWFYAIIVVVILGALGSCGNSKKEEEPKESSVVESTENKESETTALIDGDNGLGMVAAYKASKIAREKAEKAGIAFDPKENIEAMDFDAVISAVAANPNYVGLSGISITDERSFSPLRATLSMLTSASGRFPAR